MRFSYCGALAVAVIGWSLAADQPTPAPKAGVPKVKAKADIVPGYELRMIEGFSVLVNRQALEQADKWKGEYEIEPLEVLESELRALNTILIPKVLKPLQTVRIFVEWDETPPGVSLSEEEKARGGRVVALYRFGSPTKAESRVKALKMNAVEVMTLKRLTEMHQPGRNKNQIVLLHELCHAVHHVFLGYDNRDIKAAYQQAMDRHLYEKAYAKTNAAEYFAEVSCAYLDRCNFEPHTAAELKDYDPVAYKYLEQVWGKQEMIQKARERVAQDRAMREKMRKRALAIGAPRSSASAESKPTDPEKAAAGKLQLIKLQIQDGKIEKAKEHLRDLIKAYPETKAAEEARKLLDSL